MALHHYTASEEQTLVVCLAEKLNQQNSIFIPQWIVSGHNATNNYLIEQIATINGIAANIQFVQVIPLIEKIHHALGLDEERGRFLRNEQLVWYIDYELQQKEFHQLKEAEKVINYIGDDALKRFTLAEKIASLFSSYQEETPDLIKAWNNGDFFTNKEDEIWQAHIWQALKRRFGSQLRDLTQLFQDIQHALKEEKHINHFKTDFPALYFYGNLPYSDQLLDVLDTFSKIIDVYVFRREFTTQTDNPIVANLGTVLQRDRILWNGREAEILESLPKSNEKEQSLFGALKQDLIYNEFPPIKYQKSDDSLVIASSYSVSREVEALYQHLIHLFSTNQNLNAKDITVVVPDMETYAPVIKTFFDYANTIDYKGDPVQMIPYTLYDTSHRVYASPYQAFEALLKTEEDEFTSKKVMKLLDYEYIRDQFGFTNIEILIRALSQANIRHSFSGDKALETNYVSWQLGLKRLIYGFCLPPDTGLVTFDDDVFFPVDTFEESDRFELIKLQTFIENLNEWIQKRKIARTLSEWINFLEKETLNVFISEETFDTSQLRRLLGQLNQVVQNNVNETLSFEVIRYYLKSALGNMEAGERIGFGGVRFVSPSIFLSVPSKVYAFLGLNSSSFPRKVTKVSFDLSREDRLSKTDYDKNLFLSVLLAAEQKVYFSYIGNATKDNSTIPPSSLLAELEALLKDKLGLKNEKDSLILRHPLHSFNTRYNSENEPLLVNYDLSTSEAHRISKEQANESRNISSNNEITSSMQKTCIQISDLIRFIEDPVKHYFNKRLGVYMSDRDIDLAETELFELDQLQKWKVKDEFVKAKLENREVNELELKMKGDLPLSILGKHTFDKISEDVKSIIENEQLNEVLNSQEKSVPIQLELTDFVLEGSVNAIYGNKLLFLTSSKNKAKYQIRALINFYATFLEGEVSDLFCLFEGGEFKSINKVDSDKEEVQKLLEKWCSLYVKGLNELIYFDSAFLNKKEINKELNSSQLNYLVLYDTIYKNNFKNVYPSDYFCYIALNDAFLDQEKARSFLEMFEEVKNFTNPLNKDNCE